MSTSLPFFSIVIPTYDRPRQLASCLESLTALTYPRDSFEVIVVDDGSPVSPRNIVNDFSDRLNMTLLTQANAGPATARNLGAKQAKGEFLAFTDDDCAPDPDWLHSLADQFRTAPDHLIGGRTVNQLSENLFSSASQILIDYLYTYFDDRKGHFFASNNLALPASQFQAIGGFDTSFPLAAAEDREFCSRWSRAGLPMLYAPKALILHSHSLDLPRFWRQHFNYGRGACYFRQVLARAGHEAISMEPASFYSGLMVYPLSRGSGVRAIGLSMLLCVSQVANALGFFFERAKMLGSGSSGMRRGTT
jgi:GT2 family glycosyltransferase